MFKDPICHVAEKLCCLCWKNRSTRNWQPIKDVWLNPPKENINQCSNLKYVA